jgi:hypothetical protein
MVNKQQHRIVATLFLVIYSLLSVRGSSSVDTNIDQTDYTVQDFNNIWIWKRPSEGFYNVDVGLNEPPSSGF